VASPSDSRTSPTLLGRLRRSPTDQEAWHEFVQKYGPKIYGWCRRWKVQDADAHDVAQMVLVRMAARIRDFEYDPSRSFRAWLMTLSQHAWSDLVAARKKQIGSGDSRVGELLDSLQARDDLARELAEAYDLELLGEALARVRLRVQPQTWQAYQLTAVEGLSGAEAAARLNMKVTAVFKAKSNVQKLVQEEVRYLEGPGPA
jgi:RNA polymerase sigma-70 factor (ECF subfamily)